MSQLDLRAGTILRKKREEAGLSQSDMAQKTGLTQQVISRTELGASRLTLSTLRLLARALNIKVSDLAREICLERR